MFGFWLPVRIYENLPPGMFYGGLLLFIFAIVKESVFSANLLVVSGLVLTICAWQILVWRTKSRRQPFLLRSLLIFRNPPAKISERQVEEYQLDDDQLLKAFGHKPKVEAQGLEDNDPTS